MYVCMYVYIYIFIYIYIYIYIYMYICAYIYAIVYATDTLEQGSLNQFTTTSFCRFRTLYSWNRGEKTTKILSFWRNSHYSLQNGIEWRT